MKKGSLDTVFTGGIITFISSICIYPCYVFLPYKNLMLLGRPGMAATAQLIDRFVPPMWLEMERWFSG